MGGIENRLSRLETRLEAQEAIWGAEEERILAETLARFAHEDLLILTEYLNRTGEEYGEPTEEEEVVLVRLEELFEEVKNVS